MRRELYSERDRELYERLTKTMNVMSTLFDLRTNRIFVTTIKTFRIIEILHFNEILYIKKINQSFKLTNIFAYIYKNYL